MLEVSEAWKQAYSEMLSPETFVEVRLLVGKNLDEMRHSNEDGNVTDISFDYQTDNGWKEYNPVFYSNHIHQSEPMAPTNAVTLEENLWLLDGSRVVTMVDRSYVKSYEDGLLTYKINFGLVDETRSLSALTIVWSNEYDEYPTNFEVLVYPYIPGEGTIVPERFTVTGNKSTISVVDLNVTNFTQIRIKVLDWNTPNHCKRIDQIYFGKIEIFDKNNLLSFSHEESCDVLTASLPKNEISFSVSNIDGRWDPNNPKGVGQHLMEQQKLSVRYGTDINGVIEWIPGGTFFLSGWNSSPSGLDFSFVAQDVISRITIPKADNISSNGPLSHILKEQLRLNRLNENGITVFVGDDDIADLTNSDFDLSLSGAANLQLLANEHMRIFHHDRRNRLIMTPLNEALCDYPMGLDYAYYYPKITLSKPLRNITIHGYGGIIDDVEYSKDYVVLEVGRSGTDQNISNKRLYWTVALADAGNEEAAKKIKAYAEWVRDMLVSRKTISGEFRADPRLEVLDVVSIESKYGIVEPVALTTVKYTYNGSFRGYYEGRVI